MKSRVLAKQQLWLDINFPLAKGAKHHKDLGRLNLIRNSKLFAISFIGHGSQIWHPNAFAMQCRASKITLTAFKEQ